MRNKSLPMLAGVAGTLFIAGAAQAGTFDTVVAYNAGETAEGIVTLLYATGDDVVAGDTLLSTGFGNIDAVNATFYQNGFGNDFAPNAAFIPAFPSLANDSFVTFNRLTSTDDTTGGDPDFSMSDTNVSGGWFWIPGNGQGDAVAQDNLGGAAGVLIAQLTVVPGGPNPGGAGGYEGTLTLFTSGGASAEADVKFVVPAPGALALLGLAGLAGTRRRRRA